MLGPEGALSILLFLLMITQGMFICYTVSSKLLKSSNKFWAETNKQLDKNIKLLRSDRDGEYLSNDYNIYLLDNRILS